ncbi:MAG TPA: ABC transporter permease [Gemmatimonadales bacterium]|nr:ABC transporter permease [Gemmatimonadales bacterium]
MNGILQDLRYAARVLRQAPGFTLVAVLTLALGIGANAAIFSAVQSALLTPPPFPEPDRLFLVTGTDRRFPGEALPLSYPSYEELRDHGGAIGEFGAWTSFGNTTFALTGDGAPQRVPYAMGSASLFQLLGVQPSLGRLFTTAEDRFGGGFRVTLLSDALWRQRYGADPGIVGRAITLDGLPYTVIGVLPPEFRFVTFPAAPALWIPLGLDPVSPGRHYGPAAYLGVIGRLASGVSALQAQAGLNGLFSRLRQDHPEFYGEAGVVGTPLVRASTRAVRRTLQILFGVVALVLLIVCANMANLLLARGASRVREIAVRLALGARRSRIVRQLLTESVLLALTGGAAGVLLALWCARGLTVLPVFSPAAPLVPFEAGTSAPGLSLAVLGFALVVSLGVGILFGLAPALDASGGSLERRLRSSAGAGGGVTSGRLRRGLVIGQLASAFALLVVGGLLLKSYERLSAINPGFRSTNVLTLDVDLPPKYGTDEARTAFYDATLNRLAALPGVRAVGAVGALPLSGPEEATDFRIAGQAPPDPGHEAIVPFTPVTPGYFAVLHIPLRAGRLLNDHDGARAPRVAMINEAMARRYWPGEDPLGQRITLSEEALRVGPRGAISMDWDGASREVVGVVEDVRHDGLSAEPSPEVYLPYRQSPWPAMTLTIAENGPANLAAAARQAIAEVDPQQPVGDVRQLDDLVAASIGEPRARAALLGLFAALAMLLATIGVYGVIATTVGQRSREIGIRIALGAASGEVRGLILREGGRLIGIGLGSGVLLALAGSRLVRAVLFGVGSGDPLVFVLAGLLLAASALLATWWPARRAAWVDPLVVLKAE